MKNCIACGMPMLKPEQHAQGDTSKDYCVHCARPDGTMQSYEEQLASMTQFIIKTQGLDEETAQQTAKDLMSVLPAWQGM